VRTLALVAGLCICATRGAQAEDVAKPGAGWSGRTALSTSLLPPGAEFQTRAWHDLRGFALGALANASPDYVYAGAWARWPATRFLALRLEALGVGYWPLPVAGAGYYALPDANAPRDRAHLAAGDGQAAAGASVTAAGTLQGIWKVGAGGQLLVSSSSSAEAVEIGDGPYFVNLRADLTQARADLIVGNDALLAFVLPVRPQLRVGVADSARLAALSGSGWHLDGLVAALAWDQPFRDVVSLEVGARAGVFTHHPVRAGQVSIATWLAAQWAFTH